MTSAKLPGRGRHAREGSAASRRGAAGEPAGQASSQILSLDARRIADALRERSRYKYVSPRVLREGQGWKIVSPNCSRNIDAEGGQIDIAWLVPDGRGAGWLLFSRDHAQACWVMRRQEPTLAALLVYLCADPRREFWQ